MASTGMRHAALSATGLVMVYPVLWMISGSFKPSQEIFGSSSLIPADPTLQNYVIGWQGIEYPFGRFMINSLVICILAVIANVAACAVTAFAFARLDFPLRRTLFAIMLVTIMLPGQVTLIPTYSLFNAFGWVNTFLPFIVPRLLATEGFFVFLMVQFIRSIPRELDEAAEMDGCGPARTLFRVILPLLGPAVVTTAIFTFMWTYDDLFGQMIYLNNSALYTVPVGLRMFMDSAGATSWGAMFAMSVVSLIPVVLVFLFFQKRLVEGVATTGLKS